MTEERRDEIAAYLYGELDDEGARSFEEAISADPALAEEVEAQAELLQFVRRVGIERSPPPKLARAALNEAERRPEPWSRRWRRWFGRSAPSLVAVGAVAALFLVIRGDLDPALDSVPSARTSSAPPSAPPSELDRAVPRPSREAEGAPRFDVAGDEGEAGLEVSPEPSAPPPSKRRALARDDAAARGGGRRSASGRQAAEAARPNLALEAPAPADEVAFAAPAKEPASPRVLPPGALDDELGSSSRGRSMAGARAEPTELAPGDALALDLEETSSESIQLADMSSGNEPADPSDPSAGRQAEAGRLLVQAAVQARDRGRLDEARRNLELAAARVYRLPLLGHVLLLRAEVELEDQRYAAARTYAARAAGTPGFEGRARAEALEKRASALEQRDTH